MKQLFLLSISAVLMLFSFASCDDDDVCAVVPVFGEVSLDPATCYIGKDDSVTIRVALDRQSKYAQKCTYYYRISAGKYDKIKEVVTVSPGTVEPVAKMAVPDSAGVYTVTFSTSNIYFYANLPNGTIAAATNAVTGKLIVIDPNKKEEEE